VYSSKVNAFICDYCTTEHIASQESIILLGPLNEDNSGTKFVALASNTCGFGLENVDREHVPEVSCQVLSRLLRNPA